MREESGWRHSVDRSGDMVVVHLCGDIDVVSHARVRAVLLDQLRSSGKGVIADLGGVGFIDSTGLSALVAVLHAATATGKRFTLRHPDRRTTQILDITGLLDVLAPLDQTPDGGTRRIEERRT